MRKLVQFLLFITIFYLLFQLEKLLVNFLEVPVTPVMGVIQLMILFAIFIASLVVTKVIFQRLMRNTQ